MKSGIQGFIGACICVLLAGCGGSEPTASSGSSASLPSTVAVSGNETATSATSPSSAQSRTASESFSAMLVDAPADGGAPKGTVRLQVRGSGLENVELLPTGSYTPKLGIFTVSADKTSAWLDFDTTSLPNGVLLARIVAFSAPAGQGGMAVEVMPTRRWELFNDPQPALQGAIPAAFYMPQVFLTMADLPYVNPQPLSDMMALGDAAYQQMLTSDGERVRQTLRSYLPAHVVLMPAPRGFSGPWDSCLQSLGASACRIAMSSMISVMNNKPH
ncbi:hypothetical protein RY831_15525 [Noviherbaspirillum sp. CPCC 100848]|uniref:Lipoprotein n=1 Tax=Noviherbaspirillum album TaxID=3080276 RepID=A0ABU6JAW1_9BURK|nr:hypothetical protein [Noviherbaspirillum sp. CPCC 100848]MEC4720573.1 hypothetical protein [Noviherbaspirillum sp. CPCC 100848]